MTVLAVLVLISVLTIAPLVYLAHDDRLTSQPRLGARTARYLRDSEIFLHRLRDWNDSLAGGLPDELEQTLDDLIERSRAALPELPKGNEEER